MDLQGLQELLHSSSQAAGTEEGSAEPELSRAKAFFGGASSSSTSTSTSMKVRVASSSAGGNNNDALDSKAIWKWDEVPTLDSIKTSTARKDSRPEPEYDILYKQDVSSEDMFLGMGDKTPGSQDCSHMVVKIGLPKTKFADLDLTVTKQHLRAESPDFLLSLYLPLPVDDSKGNAKWDKDKGVLTVTLPIIRVLF